jgi:hypothetical protein
MLRKQIISPHTTRVASSRCSQTQLQSMLPKPALNSPSSRPLDTAWPSLHDCKQGNPDLAITTPCLVGRQHLSPVSAALADLLLQPYCYAVMLPRTASHSRKTPKSPRVAHLKCIAFPDVHSGKRTGSLDGHMYCPC